MSNDELSSIIRYLRFKWDSICCKIRCCLGISDEGSAKLFLNEQGNWVAAGGGDDAWNLLGNAGTDFTANFVGTTDGEPLLIKANSGDTFIRLGDGISDVISTASDTFQIGNSAESAVAFNVQNSLTPVITIGDVLVVGNSTTLIVDDVNKKIVLKGDYTNLNSGQRVKTRIHTIAPAVTVAVDDYIVIVNKSVGAATPVNLPAGVTGTTYIIKDGKGDAAANNITITPAAGTIDGAANFPINTNYKAVTLVYNGNEWSVISDYTT